MNTFLFYKKSYFHEAVFLQEVGILLLFFLGATGSLFQNDVNANGVVLDVLSIRGDEVGYFEWLGYAIDDNFDLATYEATTSYTTFIQTERYQTIKNKSSLSD
ncbi:MAG: hypothetical protein ACRBFS_18060 [Aureispira sp.]